jgi:hypothetical protein
MPQNHTVHLPYGVSICFVLAIKTKICTAKSSQLMWCIMVWQITSASLIVARLHIFVLVDKTKICIFRTDCVSHVTFIWPPKTRFFMRHILCDHYALVFTRLLHRLILLFSRFEFAQESKKFWELDIIDVQNRDRRKTFGKIRRALGVLRNFFGTQYYTWYMLQKLRTILYFHFYQAGHMSNVWNYVHLHIFM